MSVATWKGKVDFGIITIREDEFSAVLDRFPNKLGVVDGRRQYNLRRVETATSDSYVVAVVRCLRPGNLEAHGVVRDLLGDLEPQWILVVGIAGGVPAYEFTLGDVVVSTEVHDFSVEAALNGGSREFALSGGPVPMAAATLAANLLARRDELAGWNDQQSIGMERPKVVLAKNKFYGDDAWQKNVREKLESHFKGKLLRPPLVTAGAIASSDRLIKDAEFLQVWLRMARQILAVEMETAGVYQAVRSTSGEVPFLAIRGLSDIVGFKRHPDWTKYACHTAAAFTKAFLRMRPIPSRESGGTVVGGAESGVAGKVISKLSQSASHQSPSGAPDNEALKVSQARVLDQRPVFAWAHIADLYVGARSGSALDLKLEMRALLKDVKNCPFKLERIFVTGDIAAYGGGENFSVARPWVTALADAAGLSTTAIRIVPGNHDVTRLSTLRRLGERSRKFLRENPEELDGDLGDSETHGHLLERLMWYKEFLRDISPDHLKLCSNAIDWSEVLEPLPGVRGPIRIAGLCTVWNSDHEDAAGRMIIGRSQLEETLGTAGDDELLLMLSHHSQEWLHAMCKGWLRSYIAERAYVLHSSHGHGGELASSISDADGGVHVLAGRGLQSYGYIWGAIRWSKDNYWELGLGPRVFQVDRGQMRPDSRYNLDSDGFVWSAINLPWDPPEPRMLGV